MPLFSGNNENTANDAETCYEIVASQEEIYLEETEEEVRAILIFATPCSSDSVDESLAQAAEELITGDSDDPPLSDGAVADMLSPPSN